MVNSSNSAGSSWRPAGVQNQIVSPWDALIVKREHCSGEKTCSGPGGLPATAEAVLRPGLIGQPACGHAGPFPPPGVENLQGAAAATQQRVVGGEGKGPGPPPVRWACKASAARSTCGSSQQNGLGLAAQRMVSRFCNSAHPAAAIIIRTKIAGKVYRSYFLGSKADSGQEQKSPRPKASRPPGDASAARICSRQIPASASPPSASGLRRKSNATG